MLNIIIRSFSLPDAPGAKAGGECQAPQAGENLVHNAELQASREQQNIEQVEAFVRLGSH